MSSDRIAILERYIVSSKHAALDLYYRGLGNRGVRATRMFPIERVVSSNSADYVLDTQSHDFMLGRDGDDVIEGRGVTTSSTLEPDPSGSPAA